MNHDLPQAMPNPWRRKLLWSLPAGMAAGSPLVLLGCSGSEEDAVVGPHVKGQLAIPTGILATDLSIVGGQDEVQPSAEGGFVLMCEEKALSLVAAVHSSGRVLHYAMARSDQDGQKLDARSSAAALLFMSLGGSTLIEADRRAVYDAVVTDPQTAALARTIQARVDVNPFVMDEPDAQIVSALHDSMQSMRSRVAAAVRESGEGRAKKLAVTDIQPLLRIEPGGETNGLSVNQDGDTPGFSIVNNKRRPGLAHLYKVGYQKQDQARVDISPAEPVGTALRIAATQALSLAAVPGAFLGGSVPWEPKTSSRVPLTMHDGAEQTFYELVLLTPVWDAPELPFSAQPRYRLHREAWNDELGDMYERTQMELVFGAILEALGVSFGAINEVAFASAMANLRALAAADGGFFALMAQVRGGAALLGGIQGWFTTMAGASGRIATLNSLVLSAVAPLVKDANAALAANMAARSLSTARLVVFHGTMRAMAIAAAVGGVLDTGAQWKDLHTGDKGYLFTATLVGPKVAVSPSSGKVSKGKEQILVARVSGTQGLKLTYRWTLTGSNLANLSDKLGKIGVTIDTDSDTVTLATTPSTVGTLTITVEAFQVKAAGNRSLGTAVSELVMDDTVVALSPEVARIERVGGSQAFAFTLTPAPAETQLYEWSCESKYGSLTSDGKSTSATTPTIKTTKATATYAVRDGLDGGESETVTCTSFSTRPDPNTGETTRVDWGKATAEVNVKQKFNIQMAALPSEVPNDISMGVAASIIEALPAGASVTWSWLQSGVGSITTDPGDASKPTSSVSFQTGSTEGSAIFTASAQVVLANGSSIPILPVTASTRVKKGLRTLTVQGFWVVEPGSIPHDPICFIDAAGKEVCSLGSHDIWVTYVVPKVSNAASGLFTIYAPSGRILAQVALTHPNIKDGGGVWRWRYWGWNAPYGSYDGVSDFGKTQADAIAYLVGRAKGEGSTVACIYTLKP
jgi:hypothetical protein